MKIRYFAWLREKIGLAEEEIALPGRVQTVGDLIAWLRLQSPGHAAAFEHAGLVRCAVDQEFSTAGAAVTTAREIAFFPPVTGG